MSGRGRSFEVAFIYALLFSYSGVCVSKLCGTGGKDGQRTGQMLVVHAKCTAQLHAIAVRARGIRM